MPSLIETNTKKLKELHDAIHSNFRLRHQGDSYMEAWKEAARRFHESYDYLAFPGGLNESMRRLAEHDPVVIETAVKFLEVDPMFFRSGFIKQDLIKHLKKSALNNDQKERLQQVILARVRETNTRREFRHYCGLAVVVNDDSFEEEIKKLAGPSGIKPKHAQWVLHRLQQAHAKKR